MTIKTKSKEANDKFLTAQSFVGLDPKLNQNDLYMLNKLYPNEKNTFDEWKLILKKEGYEINA